MTRYRHVNRQAALDAQVLVMQRRASTGEKVVWLDRPVPVVTK